MVRVGYGQWFPPTARVEYGGGSAARANSEALPIRMDTGTSRRQFFDIAEAYGPFTNEVFLGKARHNEPQKWVRAVRGGQHEL
jgi:hypothetical protein